MLADYEIGLGFNSGQRVCSSRQFVHWGGLAVKARNLRRVTIWGDENVEFSALRILMGFVPSLTSWKLANLIVNNQ